MAMKARHGRGNRTSGSSSHDNVAILSNNCNNIVIAILAKAGGSTNCKTN